MNVLRITQAIDEDALPAKMLSLTQLNAKML